MKEIWKDIEGYDCYQVSNLGRVRSVDHKMKHSSGGYAIRKGKLLKPSTTHNGYLRIGLGGHKQQKWYFVHRLVYEAFIGPIPEGMQVNHIDECKTNNMVTNINLMTPKENTNWGTGKYRQVKAKKKPVIQYTLNGEEFCYWFSAIDAEKETNSPNSNIRNCCKGNRSSAGGYKWRYAS